MIELGIQFLLIWLVLMVVVKFVIGWPEELDDIRNQHPMGRILKGFLSPQTLASYISEDQMRVFKKFRLIYAASLLFVLVVLAVAAFYVDYRVHADSPLFNNQGELSSQQGRS